MPLSYLINDDCLLLTISDGCFTRKNAIDCLKNAVSDQSFEKGIPVLFDISGCEIILPFQAARLILEFLADQSGRFSSRLAFVEKNLSPFRLGCVCSAVASDYGDSM